MDVISHYKYSENHEWVRVEGKRAVIGVTDFAQDELGMVVFAELPEIGDELKAGKPLGSLESVKTVSELYAPISGKVIDINVKLLENPGIINLSPYESGWLIVMEMADPSELDQLWDAEKYKETYIHE